MKIFETNKRGFLQFMAIFKIKAVIDELKSILKFELNSIFCNKCVK